MPPEYLERLEEKESGYVPNKRWTILDSKTNRIYDLTDNEFYIGIKNNAIKLRGQFVQVGNKDQLWIDGIYK